MLLTGVFKMCFFTALDLIHTLLGFSTRRRAQQLNSKAEMGVKVACSSSILSKHKPDVLAVGVILNACEQQDLGELSEDNLDFIPRFLLTDEARACAQQLKSFIHVHARPSEQAQVTTAA